MRQSFISLLLTTLLLPTLLGGCETFSTPSPRPDHRIRVIKGPNGTIAVPPECTPWQEGWGDDTENSPWPSFGCAQARNLAAQIENPDDLIEGRKLAPADAVTNSAAIARYRSGKTTPLINPNEEKPLEIKKMTDKRVGGGESE